VKISALKLYNFRNLANQTVQFGAGANFIIGRNGQGKTNLVEAVNLLSLGRSFRTSSLAELIRWGEKACSVFATTETQSGTFELGIAVERESRKAYVNGDQVEFIASFLGRLICISFSPTDLALVKGSPHERRKFMDKHMVDLNPALMGVLVDYQRALRHKNALLKSGSHDVRQLDSWNELLATAALKIHLGRVDFLERVGERAATLYAAFSESDGGLSLHLKSSSASGEGPHSAETFLERFQSVRERELALRSTLVGPHRDEVQILLGEKPARAFASQGQSRSIVLSLKLAVLELLEERREESPVILLDDVESELDAGRRAALVKLIYERRCQTFITGTELPSGELLRAGESQQLEIEAGNIVRHV
jgi:DNA replication and repair protein RecF